MIYELSWKVRQGHSVAQIVLGLADTLKTAGSRPGETMLQSAKVKAGIHGVSESEPMDSLKLDLS